MRHRFLLLLLCFAGCAGFGRQCSSYNAENFGSDWIIVQYGIDGKPFNCWVLKETSVANETGTDGLYWKDSETKHLVHISGWYNRVQVERGDKGSAAELLGIDLTRCINGRYGAGSP